MTLANVRHNGVRSLAVRCEVCHHKVILNVDAYADEVTVPAIGPKMVTGVFDTNQSRRCATLVQSRA